MNNSDPRKSMEELSQMLQTTGNASLPVSITQRVQYTLSPQVVTQVDYSDVSKKSPQGLLQKNTLDDTSSPRTLLDELSRRLRS